MRKILPFWKRKEICHPALALLLLVVLLLRLPNFFEPYWYGDEGIYLTIGNGIRMGQRLYVDIVDHKTPLIYYFASVGSQLNFRILLVTWMLMTTIAFYRFAERIFKNQWSTIVAASFFVIWTSLPRFEGNIPNGELFVMGFVIFGLWLLSYTPYFNSLLAQEPGHSAKRMYGTLLLSGSLFGLGVLTKVPGLLDFAGALSIGWFAFFHYIKESSVRITLRKQFKQLFLQMLVLSVGFCIPIVLSVVYYVLRGSGSAYLNFGLLYNLHYSGNWDLGFTNPLLSFFFTLPGKFLVVCAGVLTLTALTKYLTPQFQFAITWSLLALFASLLSNRPYPHYFLQLVPPLALVLGFMVEKIKHSSRFLVISSGVAVFLLVIGIMKVMHVDGYPTTSYYTRAYQLWTGQLNYTQYRDSFNYLLADNHAAAQILSKSSNPYIFVWGTNPMLYALSRKQPTGRFTVSFHITDLHVEEETFKSILEKDPEYIVVMNDERAVLPGLDGYLRDNYIANPHFDHFVLWRKRSSSSL